MPVETLDIQDPEAVIRAWLAHTDARLEKLPPETAAQNRARSEYMLRLIARGQPVPAAQLALALDRPVEEIEEFYEKYRSVGGEFDAQGNLVGAALTQIPTAHRFRVNGQQLYAWCALDALFMPGLLGKTAEVESICPTTGAAIRLTIAPDRVRAYSPAETVLSITVPGLSCRASRVGAIRTTRAPALAATRVRRWTFLVHGQQPKNGCKTIRVWRS